MNKLAKFWSRLSSISDVNRVTNVYALARTFFAFSLLTNLIFSEIPSVFAEHLFKNGGKLKELSSINFFFFFEYHELWIAKIIAVVILLFIISGYFPRYTCILHWWLSFSFLHSASIIEGGDQINAVMTLYLIPIGLLDNRKNHWQQITENSRYRNFIIYLAIILIQLQIAILYLQAGIEKPYKVDEWRDGTAVYYWFNNNIFGGSSWIMIWFNELLANSFFVSLITWGTIVLELALFGAFFLDKEKKAKLFPIAVAFHFSIFIIHGLASFFLTMVGALILYLLPIENPLFKTKDYGSIQGNTIHAQ